jgi:hypothetical protein
MWELQNESGGGSEDGLKVLVQVYFEPAAGRSKQ